MSVLPTYSSEPDELEFHIASHSDVLSPCPFCGRANPMLMTATNEDTGIIVARIQCNNIGCMASVFSNSSDRAEAQHRAIEQWQRRVSGANQ